MTVTIGQAVHYFPGTFDDGQPPTVGPLAAIVASVIAPVPPAKPSDTETKVNLMVIDAVGWCHSRTNVSLFADGTDPVPNTVYAGLVTRPVKKAPVTIQPVPPVAPVVAPVPLVPEVVV